MRLCVVNKRATPGPDGKYWDGEPLEIGRALSNYAAAEIARIKGSQSAHIGSILGYADSEYVAQRESISLFSRESRPVSPMPHMHDIGGSVGGSVNGSVRGDSGYEGDGGAAI